MWYIGDHFINGTYYVCGTIRWFHFMDNDFCYKKSNTYAIFNAFCMTHCVSFCLVWMVWRSICHMYCKMSAIHKVANQISPNNEHTKSNFSLKNTLQVAHPTYHSIKKKNMIGHECDLSYYCLIWIFRWMFDWLYEITGW